MNENKREVYQKLLNELNERAAILTSGEIHEDIPTIHNFTGQYHPTVKHMGFGFFFGKTENGEFQFEGGGALRRERIDDKYFLSWCPLSASQVVLDDLNYDKPKVVAALESLIAKA